MKLTLEYVEKRLGEIQEALAKFDTLKEEEGELLAARKVLIRLEGSPKKAKGGADVSSVPEIAETGEIDLAELEIQSTPTTSGDSLYSSVEGLIKRFGEQQFSVTHVEAVLRKMGQGSESKHFKNRISLVLRKLLDNEVIELTHKGSGNIPHRYRNRQEQAGLTNVISNSIMRSNG